MTIASRRTFLPTTARLTATDVCGLTGSFAAEASSQGVLHQGYAIPARPGVQEVTTVNGPHGEYWMLFGENNRVVRKVSRDGGRSWGDTVAPRPASGDDIPVAQTSAHLSLLTLKSDKVAIIYGGPVTRPGQSAFSRLAV